jgi:hypothetical protein
MAVSAAAVETGDAQKCDIAAVVVMLSYLSLSM